MERPSVGIWLLLFVAFSLFSNLRAEFLRWPDNEHTQYGSPLFWLTHQTNSFAGPVDRWLFDYLGLSVNLVFWAFFSLAVTLFVTRYIAVKER